MRLSFGNGSPSNMRFLQFVILLWAGLLLSACTDYDVGTADTPANREGFVRHLGFQPGEQVVSVYYYADEFGADVRYQLSFECPPEIAEKIVAELSVRPGSEDDLRLYPRDDLEWWKPGATEGLPRWSTEGGEGQHRREFWYSETDGRAYYHEYSN